MDKLDIQLQHSIRGEFDLGWKLVQELEKERPNCNRCAFNRGWYVLAQGDLSKGMELISRGRWEKVFGSPPIGTNKPIFNPSIHNAKDKFIILNLEGGFGDEIIGFRYVDEVAKLGGKVIVACHPKLMDLFSNDKNISSIVASQAAELIYHDYWIPAMSAEYIFNNTFDNLPNNIYVKAPLYKVDKFSKIINSNKIKIGIRYVGNPEFEHEQHRLFPQELMFGLFEGLEDKVQVYSLQKDLGIHKKLPEHVIDLESQLETWEDTAGAIENLDLVISSCTAVPHLSSAMGKLTWIVIPILPYYVWAYKLKEDEFGGEFTSYYKSARLFRQEKYGTWNEPFEKLKKGLENYVEHFNEDMQQERITSSWNREDTSQRRSSIEMH